MPFVSELAEQFDPDQYRMSVGEHLDELRRRLIYALFGLLASFALCLVFGRQVIAGFCKPMLEVLYRYEVNPQIYFTGVGDVFVVYIRISLIVAGALAAPWMVYQLWLFVAAGLYPRERKVITRYIPLSLSLLVGGMLFVYYFVLPITLEFFILFSGQVPMPEAILRSPTTAPAVAVEQRLVVPSVDGDPEKPAEHELWFDSQQQRFKTFVNGKVRVLQMLPESLVAPIITLPDYIDLVLMMLLVFGLSFQLPLVVLALERAGIVEIEQLRAGRRYVYFAMVVIAAVITPGDVITATLALLLPLIGLYELGIVLALRGRRARSGLDEA
jgi:sec-independent protein translocase protein TatC